MRRGPLAILAVLVVVSCLAPAASGHDYPAVMTLKEQAAVYDGWLASRLSTLLPELMRREKIDMWVVICEEYNEDPVYLSLVPFASLSARRLTMLVMFDRGGDKGIEKFSVNRYGIGGLFPTVWKADQEGQWQALARAIKERDPQRIGINESDIFAFGDGLSASKKKALAQAIGPEYAKRLVGAERLAVGWLERRLPAEIEVYHSLQRPAASPHKSSPVIHRGDLLHCDIGINYLRLNTDTQQHAYVLLPGETDAPPGLKAALAQGNRLQDILLVEMKEGLTGNQILAAALKRAKDEGLRPSIYTHPLGVHGHAAGPTIGLWDKQGGVPGPGDYPLFPDTVYSIELNVRAAVAEWNGQDVQIALEQDAAFTRSGTVFLDRRQTGLYLIR